MYVGFKQGPGSQPYSRAFCLVYIWGSHAKKLRCHMKGIDMAMKYKLANILLLCILTLSSVYESLAKHNMSNILK